MRHVKNRLFDFVFRHEREQSETVKDLIAATYAAVSRIRADCSELAARRYRKGEHRIKTCWDMHISESQYYKLLSKFFFGSPCGRRRVLRAQGFSYRDDNGQFYLLQCLQRKTLSNSL